MNSETRRRPNILSNLAIHRPITILTSLMALLVIGYIAFHQISVELFPEGFSPPFLGVYTPYPNSNPKEVEEQIAKPIEEQIRTISGVQNVHTSSSSNGCWTFSVSFRISIWILPMPPYETGWIG